MTHGGEHIQIHFTQRLHYRHQAFSARRFGCGLRQRFGIAGL